MVVRVHVCVCKDMQAINCRVSMSVMHRGGTWCTAVKIGGSSSSRGGLWGRRVRGHSLLPLGKTTVIACQQATNLLRKILLLPSTQIVPPQCLRILSFVSPKFYYSKVSRPKLALVLEIAVGDRVQQPLSRCDWTANKAGSVPIFLHHTNYFFISSCKQAIIIGSTINHHQFYGNL